MSIIYTEHSDLLILNILKRVNYLKKTCSQFKFNSFNWFLVEIAPKSSSAAVSDETNEVCYLIFYSVFNMDRAVICEYGRCML